MRVYSATRVIFRIFGEYFTFTFCALKMFNAVLVDGVKICINLLFLMRVIEWFC